MKKFGISVLVAVSLVSFLFGSGNIALSTENSDVENIKAPFSSFTIAYQVDPDNPDPKRDNVPMIEYDPSTGWRFYRVEWVNNDKIQITLDKNDNRIQLSPQEDDYLKQLNMIFQKNVRLQSTTDIEADSFSIVYFCEPEKGGGCGLDSLRRQQSIGFSKSDDGKFFGGSGSTSCMENSYYIFDPQAGTLQIYDDSLQFEQWKLGNHRHVLDVREAINPDIRDIGRIHQMQNHTHGVSVISGTTAYKGYIEYFIDEDYFILNGQKYNFRVDNRLKEMEIPNYNCCKLYKGEVFVPLRSFAELMGFEFSSGEWGKDQPYIEFDVFRSIDQRIKFDLNSNLVKTRYGDDFELPMKPFIKPDDPEATYGSFPFMVPLYALLDNLPRHYGKGYWYRPMNNSILISRLIDHDEYRDERIPVPLLD